MNMYLRNLCLAMSASMAFAACGDGSEAPAAAARQAASASDEKPSHVCSLLSREQVDSVIPGNDGGQDKDASEAALLKDVAMEHCQYSHIEGMNVKFLDLIIYKASSDEGFEQIRIGESAQQGSDRRLDIGDISYLKDMSAQNEMVAKASKGRTVFELKLYADDAAARPEQLIELARIVVGKI